MRARPSAVFGPGAGLRIRAVGLDLAVAGQPVSSLGWRRLDHLKLAVLDFLHAPSQRLAEDRPPPINLVQTAVAAAIGDGGEAIEAFDVVELFCHRLGYEAIHAHAGAGEKLKDLRHGVRFAPHVLLHELFCLAGPAHRPGCRPSPG